MCELILKTIGDPLYIELVHNNRHNPHICDEISKILLDLYLNMPEKGRNETPLHLAVKFGCVEVVEVLTSYAQCSYTVNSDGKYPKDVSVLQLYRHFILQPAASNLQPFTFTLSFQIICFRCADTTSKDVINQIAELLEERFYVPVIRSVDNSMPPIIGEPFSPTNPPVIELSHSFRSPPCDFNVKIFPMFRTSSSIHSVRKCKYKLAPDQCLRKRLR